MEEEQEGQRGLEENSSGRKQRERGAEDNVESQQGGQRISEGENSNDGENVCVVDGIIPDAEVQKDCTTLVAVVGGVDAAVEDAAVNVSCAGLDEFPIDLMVAPPTVTSKLPQLTALSTASTDLAKLGSPLRCRITPLTMMAPAPG